jgi:2-C-methyl-D-erythritol 4-phosphate cytidylyltransferase
VAAGESRRFGSSKLHASLGGRSVLERSLSLVAAAADGEPILVVTAADRAREVERLCAAIPVDATVVEGGASRQASVWNALCECPTAKTVVIHDAARPLCPLLVMRHVHEAARSGCAVTAALPVADSIKRVDGARVTETLDRRFLVRVQTPQAFPRLQLVDAHRRAQTEGILADDDCALVERLGVPVTVVEGSAWSHKLTTPDDLAMLEGLLRSGVAP